VLLGNPASGIAHLQRLREELLSVTSPIEVSTDLGSIADCDIVLAATGAARPVLDGAPLRAGTIVCDVARPPDASRLVRARRDLTVIDGGLVALPDPTMRFGAGNLQGFPDGVQLACLSETILLALSRDRHDHGIGDDVAVSEVDYMMALAERHGFHLSEPPLDALDLAAGIEPLRRAVGTAR
jgi:predicted amino acid dehydrogenase